MNVKLKKITRYVALTILSTTLLICSGLISIFILFTFLAESADVGKGTYSLLDAFIYVLLQTPYSLYIIMPIGALIGAIMGLGLLSNNSEIIVIRAAGQSSWRIAKGVILSGLFIAGFTFILGAFLSPFATKRGNNLKAFYTNANTNGNYSVSKQNQSIWLKNKSDFIFIQQLTQTDPIHPKKSHDILNNILRLEIKDHQLIKIFQAKSATLEARRWHVSNVKTTHLKTPNDTIQQTQQTKATWLPLISSNILNLLHASQSLETNTLSITALVKIIHYNKNSQQDYSRFSIAFWQLIFQPLSVILLILLALPFSLGSTRTSNLAIKFMIGLILGFVFFILNQFFAPFAIVYHLSPFIATALPNLIFALILIFLIIYMRE